MSQKLGVDDFLAAGGTIGHLETMAVSFDAWLAANVDSDREVGLTKKLADNITAQDYFAQDAAGRLHRFVKGVYRPSGAAYVRQRVKALLLEWEQSLLWSRHLTEEVIEYIRVDAPELWARPPVGVLNVQNGLLDIATRELMPHSPHHLSTVQLAVAYDREATCPTWDRFVAEVFPADARVLAFEIVAHLMRPDTSIQKAVLLLGEGGNGKSTYLTALTAFLGKENAASLSLHRLESDRFAVARLLGKLANIAADLPSEHLAGTDVFKQLTGGDSMTGEFKYRDSFDFVPYARLVFSANHPPRSQDGSPAFFDRWVVLPFGRAFRGTADEIPRPVLDGRLAEPRELSGVLNRALEALPAFIARKGFFQSKTTRAAWAEFRQTTDPLAVWLDRATVEQPDAMVPKKDLVEAYNRVAAMEGRPTMTGPGFGLALKRLRPNLVEAQRTVAGRLQWVWLAIGLRPTDPGASMDVGSHSRTSRSSRTSIFVTSAGDVDGESEGEASSTGAPELTIEELREVRELRDSLGTEAPPDPSDYEEGVV